MKKNKSWLGPMPKTLKSKGKTRIDADQAQSDALISAREAGYRRGKDESDRALNTKHDNEMNRLRIEMAGIQNSTVAIMDREIVKGWMEVIAYQNAKNPESQIVVTAMPMMNALARELVRVYDKEKRA